MDLQLVEPSHWFPNLWSKGIVVGRTKRKLLAVKDNKSVEIPQGIRDYRHHQKPEGHLGGSVEDPTLDVGSGHDPRVVGSSPTSGSALSMKPAWDSISLSLCPSPLIAHTL